MSFLGMKLKFIIMLFSKYTDILETMGKIKNKKPLKCKFCFSYQIIFFFRS